MNNKKIVFAGSNNIISYSHLKILIKYKFNILAVLTKPHLNNFKKNKKLNILKKIANKNRLLFINIINQNKIYKILKKINPDIMIVVSYGLIINSKILKLPTLGCFNIHYSILPRWRGAAPIERAILANDLYTGISIIKMNGKLDSGPIIYFKKCFINYYDNAKSILKKLLKLSLKGIIVIINKIYNNIHINLHYQNKKYIIYAKKISKEEGLINWKYPAIYLERCIRAFNIWPGCYFYYKNMRIKVYKSEVIININNYKYFPGTILQFNHNGIQISTSKDILNILKIQLPGKKKLDVKLLLNSKKKIFITGDII